MSDTPQASGSKGRVVELASLGRYYQSGSSQAVINHLTGEHEAMFADATGETFPTVMDRVLRETVIQVPVVENDFDKLLIGDKYHLMFAVRNISYPSGGEYGFTLTCPKCSSRNNITLDLEKDIIMRNPPEGAKEPFMVDLPVSGHTVGMRLLRVMDEVEMIKFVRKARQRQDLRGDPAYLYAMSKGMLTMDGEPIEFEQSFEFVRHAASADTLAIRDAMDEYDIGPELELDFTCERCGHYWFQRMPLDADFFRPGVAKRRRASRSKI